MTKAAMKTLLAAAVGAATFNLGLVTESAQAFTLTYDFTVEVTRGFCAVGNTVIEKVGSAPVDKDSCGTSGGTYVDTTDNFKGKATYNASKLTGSGVEELLPGSGNLAFSDGVARYAQADLKIQFEFQGKSFTEVDDFQYPKSPSSNPFGFPRLRFSDGQLVGLDYLVVPPAQEFLGFRIFRGRFFVAPVVTADVSGNITSFKAEEVGRVIPPAAPVPEPSEVGGLLLAGGFLGALVWKMRSRKGVVPIDDAIDVANRSMPDEKPVESLK